MWTYTYVHKIVVKLCGPSMHCELIWSSSNRRSYCMCVGFLQKTNSLNLASELNFLHYFKCKKLVFRSQTLKHCNALLKNRKLISYISKRIPNISQKFQQFWLKASQYYVLCRRRWPVGRRWTSRRWRRWGQLQTSSCASTGSSWWRPGWAVPVRGCSLPDTSRPRGRCVCYVLS